MGSDEGSATLPAEAAARDIPSQTPLFYALQKDRYLRQEWIREIQSATGRTLIVYVANPSHPAASINQDDIPPFADLLQHVSPKDDLDLLIHSGGGDIDAAERIVYLCRKRSKSFRVIVTNSAKSAATLIAIAADSIVMGDISELGPIDPQIFVSTPEGEPMWRPAQSFLDGLERIKQEAAGPAGLSPAYYPILDKLDPALLDFAQKAIDRSKLFARKWLLKGMSRGDDQRATEIADRLCNVSQYLSHGAVIDADEASEIGLKVDFLTPDSELWQRLWRLQELYDVQIRQLNLAKIFESEKSSITVS